MKVEVVVEEDGNVASKLPKTHVVIGSVNVDEVEDDDNGDHISLE